MTRQILNQMRLDELRGRNTRLSKEARCEMSEMIGDILKEVIVLAQANARANKRSIVTSEDVKVANSLWLFKHSSLDASDFAIDLFSEFVKERKGELETSESKTNARGEENVDSREINS